MYQDVLDISTERQELTTADLSLLTLPDVDAAKALIDAYADLDVVKESLDLFKLHLMYRKDSWFVQVSDVGLLYLTEIIPTFTANFKVVFWDKKFSKDRRELAQAVIATAFDEFKLARITALVPETNKPLREVAMKKIGFVQEGILRRGWRADKDIDCYMFSLLRDEVKGWPIVDHLKVDVNAGY